MAFVYLPRLFVFLLSPLSSTRTSRRIVQYFCNRLNQPLSPTNSVLINDIDILIFSHLTMARICSISASMMDCWDLSRIRRCRILPSDAHTKIRAGYYLALGGIMQRCLRTCVGVFISGRSKSRRRGLNDAQNLRSKSLQISKRRKWERDRG